MSGLCFLAALVSLGVLARCVRITSEERDRG